MKRFIIAKIGKSSEINYLAPYIHVVHKMTVSVPGATQEASFWTTAFGAGWEGISAEPVVEISSVYFNITFLNKVENYNGLASTPNSFWFDQANQEINVRVYLDTPSYSLPTHYGYGLLIGLLDNSGFDETGLIDSTIGGISYHPALISQGLSAMLSIDSLSENKLIMDGFSISVNNASGLFDLARILFYKQRIDLYVAEIEDNVQVTASDFKLLRTAIVDNVRYTSDQLCQIDAIDPRQTMDRQVPFTVFTETDFDDPTDARALQYIGKTKPIAIGRMWGVPTVPLSPATVNNGSRHFVSSTEFGPIDYVSSCWEIVDGKPESRSFTMDYSTGVLTITTASYTGGDVIVDGFGLELGNGVYGYPYFNTGNNYRNMPQQIAFLLITKFGNIPNTTGYIDKASFVNTQIDQTDSKLYIPTGGENLLALLDYVTLPCNWLMYVEGGLIKAGPITPVEYTPDRLYIDELAEPPNIEWDAASFGTRLEYKYYRDIYYDKYHSYLLTDKEPDLIAKYRVVQTVTIESPVFSGGASRLAPPRYESIAFIPAVLTCQLLELPRWKLLDFIIFDYLMDGRQRLPELVYRVVGIDPLTNTVILRQHEDSTAMEGSMLNFYRRLNAKGA
jgi:hypothetical protein